MGRIVLSHGQVSQTDQRICILGLGLARLLEGIACGVEIFALQRLVTLGEQALITGGVHQVLPPADKGGVLLFAVRGRERSVGRVIAALPEQGQAERAVQARVFGVMLECAP